MTKAEKIIQDYTRNWSNEIEGGVYHEWLTPEQALRAVEIEREEVIEKAIGWLGNNVNCGIWIMDFHKAMTDE